MNITLIPARELTPDDAHRWSQLQQADPTLASPYLCPQFTHAVASVRQDVSVALMEEGGQLLGFFPFQRDAMGVGRPVGGALSDCQAVVAHPSFSWDAAELIRGCRLSSWSFDHLLAAQTPFAPYHRTVSTSPYMDLSGGYEAYAKARRESGSEQIKKTANLTRKLEREHGPLRFDLCSVDAKVLGTLIQWKSAQYRESGISDVFAFGWTVRLLEHLLAVQTPSFAGVLSALFLGDRLIAAHMGMRSGRVWHYWFPAYDPQFAKFSPGLILLLKMAEAAPSLGIHALDMGKGDTLYKSRLASGATPLAAGEITLSRTVAALRAARERTEQWIRATPLRTVARIPGRWLRAMESRRRFR